MTREEYDREANRLLLEFRRVYDPYGPAHGHNSFEARTASTTISNFVRLNWNDDWYKKPR